MKLMRARSWRRTPEIMTKAPLGLALILAASAFAVPALGAQGFTVVDERSLAVQERPHGEIGMTTAYRYTDAVENADVVLRRRDFHPGSEYGAHEVGHDQAYYVLSGEGEIVADGVARRLSAGMSAYVFEGAVVSVKQLGDETFSVLMTWPLDAAPEEAGEGGAARAAVVMRDRDIARDERPHGGVGMSTGYRYSDHVENRAVHFRRRTLQRGSEIAAHEIPSDQGYYVLDGSGTLTVDGAEHDFKPGVAAYAYKGSTVRIAPDKGREVSYLLIEPVPAAVVDRPQMIVSQADIGERETPPHNGSGDSVSYRYTDLAPGLDVELRKRDLAPGAVVGEHHLGQDQVFYVLEGEMDLVTPQKTYRLTKGMSAYGVKGTPTTIRQRGAKAASYICVWAR